MVQAYWSKSILLLAVSHFKKKRPTTTKLMNKLYKTIHGMVSNKLKLLFELQKLIKKVIVT